MKKKVTLPILKELLKINNVEGTWEYDSHDEVFDRMEEYHNHEVKVIPEVRELISVLAELSKQSYNFTHFLYCSVVDQQNRTTMFDSEIDLVPIGFPEPGIIEGDESYEYYHMSSTEFLTDENVNVSMGLIISDMYGDSHELIHIDTNTGQVKSLSYELDEDDNCQLILGNDQMDFINRLRIEKDDE